jgi:hypothetical protein
VILGRGKICIQNVTFCESATNTTIQFIQLAYLIMLLVVLILGKYVTVFQAEIYAILACVCEIQSIATSEKEISICSDSQAALAALQAMKMSPLV